MKPIKLHITRLGRVSDTDLEIFPVMVFSGESGYGKSYMAILCHFFFQVFLSNKSFHKFFSEQGFDYVTVANGFGENGTAITIHKREIESWLASEALRYISYMLGNDKMDGDILVTLPEDIPNDLPIKYKKETAGIQGSEQEDVLLDMGNLTYRVRESADFDESPFAFLTRYVMIDYIWSDWKALKFDFVMPPSRGPLLSEKISPVSGLFQEYAKGFDALIKASMRSADQSHVVLEKLHQILEGEVTKEDTSFFYKTGEVKMPITAAAASIRELAPIQFLAQKTDVSKAFVLVEEPEAHLHPLKQRMMADILCCLAKSGTYLQITTHSDYFLHRFNEILQWSEACKRNVTPERLRELSEQLQIQEDFSIDTSIVGAYVMLKREDGSTYAKQQTLEEGVPYQSFLEALKMNIYNKVKLDETLSHAD